jgi:hypothetical protein
MARYQPLADFLASRDESEWDASFAEIESRLGFSLPPAARKYPAWWANQRGAGHAQTHGWRSVGWRTTRLDLARKRVRFVRERSERAGALSRTSAMDDHQSLIDNAGELTGIKDRDQLVVEALKALVEREAARRLARLGGTMPGYRPPDRERP